MGTTEAVTLTVTAPAIDAYCRQLGDRARGAGQLLAELMALQAFVSAHVDAVHRASPPYNAIQLIITRHAEVARERLLHASAAELAAALATQATADISRLHGRLSRHGFEEAAQRALPQLEVGILRQAAVWAGDWCRDAERRAQDASGYPDALNFAGAGIQPGDYAAMQDLQRYLAYAVLQAG
mgnify:FL=1